MFENLDDNQKEEDVLIDIDNIDEETLEAGLQAALYRRDCPETIELSEYQLGLLAEAKVASLKTHINRCPHCQAELDRLAEFLAEEAGMVPAPLVGDRSRWTQGNGFEWRQFKEAGRIVFRFMEEALNNAILNLQQGIQPSADQAVYGGLRSSHLTLFEVALKEDQEDFEAVITIDINRHDPNHCTITVDVNIPSRGGWPNLANTEVILKQNDIIVATQSTNAFGKAVFERIATAELAKLSFEITPNT